MARRRRSRRLGALGEPITGSLLLWGGAAFVAWLLLGKRKPEKKDDTKAPAPTPTASTATTERLRDIAKRSDEPRLLPPAPKSAEEVFKEKLSRGLDAAKLKAVRAAAAEDFFGPLWQAGLLDEYIGQACSGTTPNARTACSDARSYGQYRDESAQREERGEASAPSNKRPKGLGAPLPNVRPLRPLRLFPPMIELGLPPEYSEPYYTFLGAYFEQATFPQTQVVYTALCAEDAGSSACKVAESYRKKQAPRL